MLGSQRLTRELPQALNPNGGASPIGALMGTLEDRYAIYVQCMIDLGQPYVDFDTWLNR